MGQIRRQNPRLRQTLPITKLPTPGIKKFNKIAATFIMAPIAKIKSSYISQLCFAIDFVGK